MALSSSAPRADSLTWMSEPEVLRIGTRGSLLALTQTEWLEKALRERNPGLETELLKIRTTGDKITDVALAQVGGKGLFTKEIEEALLGGDVDLAVHSMKDIPTEIPRGLILGAFPQREEPRDALISRDGKPFPELPEGALIGTSSLRRRAQLYSLRPDLRVVNIRGNLDTRLRKLSEGQVDALVLAAAGLKRLGWEGRITELLPLEVLLPAVGQGALALEMREGDERVGKLLSPLEHPPTRAAVLAERALMRELHGGCQVPVGACAEAEGGKLKLSALVASLDGRRSVRGEDGGPPEEAETIGARLAGKLLAEGGEAILEEIRGRVG